MILDTLGSADTVSQLLMEAILMLTEAEVNPFQEDSTPSDTNKYSR